MVTKTAKLGLSFSVEGARHNLVRINEALTVLDAICTGLSVESTGTNDPPPTPVDGSSYVIGTAPTDDWVGQPAGTVAIFTAATGWKYIPLSTLKVSKIWDETAKSYKIRPEGYAEEAQLPLPPDTASSSPFWTGMHTPDGRKLMRKKTSFSSMTNGVTTSTAHSITGMDIATVFINGMARSATIARPLAQSGFTVEVDATHVKCTPSFVPTGWSVDVFVDYAVTP